MTDYLSKLPIELIHKIMDNLAMHDILTSFGIVNKRLHFAFVNYRRFQLDFNDVKKWQHFDYFCKRSFDISSQIVSINFANRHDATMPLKIHRFFSDFNRIKDRFANLYSLSLSHIDRELWKSIKNRMKSIDTLISLSIHLSTTLLYNVACQLTTDILRDLINWSSSLNYVYLEADDRSVDISRFNLRKEQTSSIKHLTLRHIAIDIQQLYSILSCLHSLDTKMTPYRYVENIPLHPPEHLQQLSIHVNRFHFLMIEQLLYPMTQLNYLTIIGDHMYNDVCDGVAWERILTRIVMYKFTFSFEQESIKLESFCSSFWLEHKRWYVQCDRCTIGGFSLLYSIPYFMNTYPWFRMKGSIVSESTGQQSLSFCNVNHLIVDYQRPINNELRNRFTNIQQVTVQDYEKSFPILIHEIVPYIDLSKMNTLVIDQCCSEVGADIFVQFILDMSHLHSITIPIDLLRLLFVNCWPKINRLKIVPERHTLCPRFTEKGLTLNEVDMFCSSFSQIEQLSFHADIMPYLPKLLTNVSMTLSTLVIEHYINGERTTIDSSTTYRWLNNYTRLHRFSYKLDENMTAIVWL